MNNLRKSALLRWRKKLENDLSKIPKDKKSLLMKAALCGFLAGDGSVQVRKEKNYSHYQLDFFPDDKEMLDTYCSFIKSIYGKSPTISIRYNVYNARISQKFIVYDLMKLCNFGIYKWNFPNNLFKIKGAKEKWLRAFYSAEGYVNNKTIKIQSVNLKSIKIVSDLLNEMEIYHSYYVYTPKNINHSKVGMIFIGSFDSRMKYYKKIGFWHSKKEKKLKQALDL